MCRFQKEINSKIQEKKASENPADSRSPAPCSAPSTSPEDANPSCYTAAEVKPKLEEEATDGVDESSSDAEQLPHGGESVRTGLCMTCDIVHGMLCLTLKCVYYPCDQTE